MRHTVHIYAVVRIPIRDIEASNQTEAMKKADEELTRRGLLDFLPGDIEDACETVGYLVDEAGDEDFVNSKSYDCRREEANHPYIKEEPCETGTEHVNDHSA